MDHFGVTAGWHTQQPSRFGHKITPLCQLDSPAVNPSSRKGRETTEREKRQQSKMVMIMRAIKFVAYVFAAGCPITADAFVYRSAAATTFGRANRNSISRQQQARQQIQVKNNKGTDSAIVGHDRIPSSSSPSAAGRGHLAGEAGIRIPRVPSALDPEGVVRRVGTPLRMMSQDGTTEVSASLFAVFPHPSTPNN